MTTRPSQLLTSYKKETLYYYFVDHKIIQKNNNFTSILPAAIRTQLLQFNAFNSNTIEGNNVSYRIFSHLIGSSHHFVKNNIQHAIKAITNEKVDPNVFESIVELILQNNQLVKNILSGLSFLSDEKLKNKILYDYIQQCIYSEIIKNEIKNLNINTTMFLYAWDKLKNNFFAENKHGLNLHDKLLLHAYNKRDSSLYNNMGKFSPYVHNFTNILKLTEKLGEKKISAQQWMYQLSLKNALKQYDPWTMRPLFQHYYRLNVNNLIDSSSLIEEFIAGTCLAKQAGILDTIISLIPPANFDSVMNKAIKLLPNDVAIHTWLYQTLFQNEYNNKHIVNAHILKFVLCHGKQAMNQKDIAMAQKKLSAAEWKPIEQRAQPCTGQRVGNNPFTLFTQKMKENNTMAMVPESEESGLVNHF